MNAGTAQRITLNALSSLLMIRLGRVYGGLMVDVQPANEKLGQRSEKMLQHLTGCNVETAQDALSRAGGNVKIAVLLVKGCTLEKARSLLDHSQGRLRAALSQLGKSP